jgi:hypothetical protein
MRARLRLVTGAAGLLVGLMQIAGTWVNAARDEAALTGTVSSQAEGKMEASS